MPKENNEKITPFDYGLTCNCMTCNNLEPKYDYCMVKKHKVIKEAKRYCKTYMNKETQELKLKLIEGNLIPINDKEGEAK